MYNTEFYRWLKSSENNTKSLMEIISIIKPLIRYYSTIEDEITGEYYYDKDFESTLIEYVINSIKIQSLADILAKDKEKKQKNFNL